MAHGISKQKTCTKRVMVKDNLLNSCDEQKKDPAVAAKNRRVEVKIFIVFQFAKLCRGREVKCKECFQMHSWSELYFSKNTVIERLEAY